MKMAESGTRDSGTAVSVPTTSKRVRERRQYTDDFLQDEEIEGRRMFSVDEKLETPRFGSYFVKEMTGDEFNLKYLQECGFESPVVIKDKAGLGMRVPSSNFTVNDVKQCVGSRRVLDVMDVTTQKDTEMSMKDWCLYFENPVRDQLLNVISLEFSHTKLDNYVESPAVVRQLDWVDLVWPRHLKESQRDGTNALEEMKYPKVQKYCLMSVKGCYTDFHVDFGGTSVWYHIIRGAKIFWLIPPTERNIHLYEQWVLSGKQGDIFFGDTVDKCARVQLFEGYTFFIPTGWIHAVYTPEDSLVFGGNFLHGFGMAKQIRIVEVEDVTHVPMKFRYPFYTEIMWYTLQRYVYCYMGKNHLAVNENGDDLNPSESPPDGIQDSHGTEGCEKNHSLNGFRAHKSTKLRGADCTALLNARKGHHITKFEIKGLRVMLDWLQYLPANKKNIPDLIIDADELIADAKALIKDYEIMDDSLVVTGNPSLFWTIEPKKRPKPRPYGPPAGPKGGPKTGGKSASGNRRRRTRCKKCEACLRTDCGECNFCKDMKKNGGPGRMKQTCKSRQCMAPNLPHTACCALCGEDGWGNANSPDENEVSSLMECSQCWEIVHPSCLKEKHQDLQTEGLVSDTLPNSWECPRCTRDGKPEDVKPRAIKPAKALPTTSPSSTNPDVLQSPQRRKSEEHEDFQTDSPLVTPCSVTMTMCDMSLIKSRKAKEHVQEERLSDGENRIIEPFRKKIKTDSGQENRGSNTDEESMSSPVSSPSPKERLRPTTNLKLHKSQRQTSESSDGEKEEGGTESRPQSLPHSVIPSPLRKHSGTSRERLFRNMKGLKKSSELSRYTIPRIKIKALSDSSNSCSILERKDGTLPLKSLNTIKPCLEIKKVSRGNVFISGGQYGHKEEPKQNMSFDKTNKQSNSGQQIPPFNNYCNTTSREKTDVYTSKFVSQHLPVLEDTEQETDCGTSTENLALEKEVMLPVFHFLNSEDLFSCQLVCKSWNRWCLDPRLWTNMDLSRRTICANILMGIVRRQPVTLNLSWTNVVKKQLSWLISRLPQLKDLVLSGCSAATLSALCSSGCPLLRSLDVCWAEGLVDSVIRELLSPPTDSRPGFIETKTRLRQLMEVRLAGADISDVSVRLMAHQLPLLSRLDLSHCHKVTDMGIAVLGAAKIVRLTHLDVSSCSNITDTSLEALKRCSNLVLLDMRECPQVTELACQKFVSHLPYSMTVREGKFMERKN